MPINVRRKDDRIRIVGVAAQLVPFVVAIPVLTLSKMAASSPSPESWAPHERRYVEHGRIRVGL